MLTYFLQSPPFVIRSMTLFFLTWGSGSWGSMLGSYYEVLKKIWPPHLRDVIHEWNFNRNHLLSDIDTQNWDVWDEWRIKFLNVVNTHAPLRTKRVRSKRFPLDYFRVEKTDAWTRHHAWSWKQYIHSKNTQDWGEFKRLRNKTNSNIKTTKESEYYKQSFTEHNNDSRRTCQL